MMLLGFRKEELGHPKFVKQIDSSQMQFILNIRSPQIQRETAREGKARKTF